MRALISFLIGLLTMAAIVALGVLVVQNSQNAQLSVQGNAFQVAQGWLVAGAAAVGFLLSFLLLIPGRLASAFRSWGLSRQGQRLEQRLQSLRDEYAQLQGSHQRLLEEHHHVLDQVLAPVTAGRAEQGPGAPAPTPAPAPAPRPASPVAAPPAPAMPSAMKAEAALQRTGPIRPPRPEARLGADNQPAHQQQQTSWMSRMRQRLAAWRARVGVWFQRRRDHNADRSAPPNRSSGAAA
jgi:hypothetical protein